MFEDTLEGWYQAFYVSLVILAITGVILMIM
jgi:hypothetical protein